MLRRIRIEGFKSLEEVEINLGQINVFIGANGAGKSNLLEAIGVLGAAASGRVDDAALLARGVRPGLPALYKTSFKGHKFRRFITISADWERDNGTAGYRVGLDNPISKPRPTWAFNTEYVTANQEEVVTRSPRGGGLVPREKDVDIELTPESGLAALYRGHERLKGSAADLLTALNEFAIFSPTTSVLRAIAQDSQPRRPVGLYGGNLAQACTRLEKEASKPEWKRIISDTIGLLDWVKDFEATGPAETPLSPSVSTSRTVLKFTDRFMREGRNILSGYDASEGALYTLFMLVLAAHPESPSTFAIDNFDQALNPRLARELTAHFSRLMKLTRRQALLTTHNPLVLDGLNLRDEEIRLFTVSRGRDGETRIARVLVDMAMLEQEQIALSRLWVSGRIGGVPRV